MTETRTGNLIGYARVSTTDQDLAAQLDKLNAAECTRIFQEHASGALRERPQLDACLDYLRPGDTLVVCKLDRLGRSLPHLIETIRSLADRQIGFRSLAEAIDTTTPVGRLLLHVLGAVAEFERDLVIERTRAGLAAAKARGRTGGRPAKITAEKLTAARSLIEAGHTVRQAADAVGVGKSTLYDHLGEQPAPMAQRRG